MRRDSEGGGISAKELKAGEILGTGGHCRTLWRCRVLERGRKFATKQNPPRAQRIRTAGAGPHRLVQRLQ